MQRLKFHFHKLLQRTGYKLVSMENMTVRHLRHMLTVHRIATVIDVGANCGQYGMELRRAGFLGKIISCEPLQHPFEKLKASAAADLNWHCLNVALSDQNQALTLNVSQSPEYSSVLPLLPSTVDRDSNARVTRVETVTARTLDSIWTEMDFAGGPTMLKIDTQGSEPKILRGASSSLPKLAAVQLELSAEPIYAGQPVMETMIGELREAGFVPFVIWPGFHDIYTGRVLEYEGIFIRAS